MVPSGEDGAYALVIAVEYAAHLLFPIAMMRFSRSRTVGWLAAVLGCSACAEPRAYDVVLRGGTLYDGSGGPPVVGDVALRGDSIVAMGVVAGTGALEIDAAGLAVAP
ncbi:MAG: hypothetical protein RJA21_305, partial [Gemmatimonadota bacterium]